MAKKKPSPKESLKSVATITHTEDKRKNIPTIEYRSMVREDQQSPVPVRYPRNPDLDPQLVWRGKDEQDWSDLVVHAPPLYIQEKVHPKVLIDDLMRVASEERLVASGKSASHKPQVTQLTLFSDFNGVPEGDAKTEFYQHDQNWSNRMILGDSLHVMASLAEREGLRGKVQCIYFDPPYGIKFNSNFQWSTTSRDVKDGKADHITREPEQVKAFRDTWRDGIHSYLTTLRDRLTVARDLLTDSGSIFVQIGDENVHRVRAVMDEVFGDENAMSTIIVWKTSSQTAAALPTTCDFILWYARNRERFKYRQMFTLKDPSDPDSSAGEYKNFWKGFGDYMTEKQAASDVSGSLRRFRPSPTTSQSGSETTRFPFPYNGTSFTPGPGGWKTNRVGFDRLAKSDRLLARDRSISYVRFLDDFPVVPIADLWADVRWGFDASEKRYVVETNPRVVQRCILMATDPGDLVLDPTCGSGTTAYVAEQWGRRWITIDTSRVAMALARARIMGARYPYYLLADSIDGQAKESQLRGLSTDHKPLSTDHYNNIRHGFVYERVPHITLKSIANNAEIDVIWDKWQTKIEPMLEKLSQAVGGQRPVASEKKKNDKPVTTSLALQEWEVPRERPDNWPQATQPLITAFWEARIARQKEIDASIAAKAEFEYLYDKPYENKKKVRVAGPFTVESLSPHRSLGVDENDELIDPMMVKENRDEKQNFPLMILENLKTAGVQQAHKDDRITFTSVVPWPGDMVCAEGTFEVDSDQWLVAGKDEKTKVTSHKSLAIKRAAIFIGPEFGTVQRQDLVLAAREAGDAGFDVLIACGFNFDAMSTEFNKLGRIPVLKARMNADLHMAENLKNTGKGNLFVIFGEPDVEVVSGLWLVASNGRMVASYDRVKELSRLGSLEEINRFGGSDLRRFQNVSAGGAVWSDESDSTSSSLGAVKHRGGSRKDGHRGVSELSQHGQRLTRGSGNTDHTGSAIGNVGSSGSGQAADSNSRTQPHARWLKEVAAIEELTSSDFPLTLTTSHYSQVTVHGVDVFHPNTGEVRSDGPDGIACWFIDTDYNEESFFVRHAYFLGQNDPYTALKTTLKAEIDADAWSTLHSDTSRPFETPNSGRIAVKVINHLGDEVMKVFRV